MYVNKILFTTKFKIMHATHTYYLYLAVFLGHLLNAIRAKLTLIIY